MKRIYCNDCGAYVTSVPNENYYDDGQPDYCNDCYDCLASDGADRYFGSHQYEQEVNFLKLDL